MRARAEFPLARPSWPGTLPPPPVERRLGVDYDTAWSRRYPARMARAMLLDNVTRPAVFAVCSPRVEGLERFEHLPGPLIFAANHASHVDTALLLSCLPARLRHRTVVVAAADYFFDRRWKAAFWSLTLASIPVERARVHRGSAGLAADLIEDGWNLVIFPEGGRSRDGWGQEFKGGAAYLARRCGVPVVPVHLHGTRNILPKGGGVPRPGSTEVRFGEPLMLSLAPAAGERTFPPAGGAASAGGMQPTAKDEDARQFAARIERAVAVLADEAGSDWWSAKRRAAGGTTPPLRGPEAAAWRRAWDLPRPASGMRRRSGDGSSRAWPRARS